MSIFINTPSGNIGRALTQTLLEAGEKVTLLARSPDKIKDLAALGARVVPGTMDDERALAAALDGARSVFWLTPPLQRPDWLAWGSAAAAQAAKLSAKAGVTHAVLLSSVGAQHGAGTGPVNALLPVERAFEAAIANTVALRAGFFMENLLHDLPSIAGAGSIFAPVAGDIAGPWVATRDIAAKAASYLLAQSWTGHHHVGVHGPKDLSYTQAAAVLSQVLGRPVQYVQVPAAAARQGMLGAGMPEFIADAYLEMYEAFGNGKMRAAEARTPQTTTPTTLAAFAREVLAPALQRLGQ